MGLREDGSGPRLLGARSGSGSGSAKRIFSKIAGSEAFSGAFLYIIHKNIYFDAYIYIYKTYRMLNQLQKT
jgi:hypothetical protein